MEKRNFESIILSKFSPKFSGVKDLARKLRDTLFYRPDGGELLHRNSRDAPTLYDPMIDAFTQAMAGLDR